MEAQRETNEINVGRHTVVLYSYCNGDEHDEIEKISLKGAKFSMVGVGIDDVKMDFDASSTHATNRKAVELLVVSLDGDSSNVVSRVYQLPFTETQQIIAALDEVLGKKKAQEQNGSLTPLSLTQEES